MSSAPAVAIGRLSADGPWLGIVAEEAGFRLNCPRYEHERGGTVVLDVPN